MKKIFLLLLLYSYCNIVSAQTVINDYAAVLGTLPCDNTFQVDDASDFNIGDLVLMIQMKGAVIDSTNTSNFGNVINYRGAGNYEYNVVKSINGNAITLWYSIVHEFNIPHGKVQFVRVPVHQNYSVNLPHTCMAWNGNKGGVFAIRVGNTLSINDSINVSGKGFKGGTNTPVFSQPIVCNITPYFMPPNVDSSGMKGEGIASVSLAKSYGRGKLSNGGGGGNAHNGGGGGGSNGNIGGSGGSEYYGCNNNPAINNSGGQSGIQLLYTNSNNKVFLGGGGGGAQSNNTTSTNGGDGGGIILIDATTISGNNKYLAANGNNAVECINAGTFGSCHDGMGGGGGAGSIILHANSISSPLNSTLIGGKGGNVASNATYGQVGPGGGGSGGVMLFKNNTAPPNVLVNHGGGMNGIINYNNSAWGAQAGSQGQIITGVNIVYPSDTFNSSQLVADFTDAEVNCYTRNFFDNSQSASSTINSWTWLFPDNSTSTQQNPTHTFPGYGTYNVTLVITDNNGCSESITKPIVIEYVRFANAGNDTTICAGAIANVNASGGIAYSWSPAAQMSTPTLPSSNVNISAPTIFTVIVTDNRGCVDKDSVLVNVNNGPDVKIISDDNNVSCNSQFVQLKVEGAQSYIWQPAEFCNDSTSSSPIVSPTNTTTFLVTGTDQYGCISTDTITIVVYKGDAQIFMPNAFSPNMDGNNDEIKPLILCDFTLEVFSIYNRWGQRVFVTQSMGKGWNGLFKDKTADVGSYFYLIKGKDGQGKTVTLKGDITLVR